MGCRPPPLGAGHGWAAPRNRRSNCRAGSAGGNRHQGGCLAARSSRDSCTQLMGGCGGAVHSCKGLCCKPATSCCCGHAPPPAGSGVVLPRRCSPTLGPHLRSPSPQRRASGCQCRTGPAATGGSAPGISPERAAGACRSGRAAAAAAWRRSPGRSRTCTAAWGGCEHRQAQAAARTVGPGASQNARHAGRQRVVLLSTCHLCEVARAWQRHLWYCPPPCSRLTCWFGSPPGWAQAGHRMVAEGLSTSTLLCRGQQQGQGRGPGQCRMQWQRTSGPPSPWNSFRLRSSSKQADPCQSTGLLQQRSTGKPAEACWAES